MRPACISFETSDAVKQAMRAHPEAIPPIKKSKVGRVVTSDQRRYGGGLGGFAKRALLQYLSLPPVTWENREEWLGATEYTAGDQSVINDGDGVIWLGGVPLDEAQALALASCLIRATAGAFEEAR